MSLLGMNFHVHYWEHYLVGAFFHLLDFHLYTEYLDQSTWVSLGDHMPPVRPKKTITDVVAKIKSNPVVDDDDVGA